MARMLGQSAGWWNRRAPAAITAGAARGNGGDGAVRARVLFVVLGWEALESVWERGTLDREVYQRPSSRWAAGWRRLPGGGHRGGAGRALPTPADGPSQAEAEAGRRWPPLRSVE